MEIIKLSNRLNAIASFIPPDSNVADIGTDHGYIPVWLAQNSNLSKIVAADINNGPLMHAKQTADEYGVTEKIRFELCSGLEFENSSDYNTVIIAGMGGELIASILEAAPWTKNGTTLILQPNSRIQVLNEWLISNGFCVKNAKLVKDAGKIYQILIVQAGKAEWLDAESRLLVHPIYLQKHDPLLSEYLQILLNKYQAVEKGMLSGKVVSPELKRTQTMICDLSQMKREADTWQL